MSTAVRRAPGLGGPLTVSVLLHGAVIAAFVLWKSVGVPESGAMTLTRSPKSMSRVMIARMESAFAPRSGST